MSKAIDRIQRRYADNPKALQMIERIAAEVAAIGPISEETLTAIQAIRAPSVVQ